MAGDQFHPAAVARKPCARRQNDRSHRHTHAGAGNHACARGAIANPAGLCANTGTKCSQHRNQWREYQFWKSKFRRRRWRWWRRTRGWTWRRWRRTRRRRTMKISIRKKLRAGVALIIVMIAIVVLSIFAAAFAYSMKVETKLASTVNNDQRLVWLARSGAELARWELVEEASIPNKPFDSLNDYWAGGSGSIAES